MSFEIPALVIEDGSPEAQAVEQVMREAHISAAEAVVSILRNAQPTLQKPLLGSASKKNHEPNLAVAEALPVFGMFADIPGFSEAIDEIIASRGRRYSDLA